jgi:hypothetical protein
VDSPYLRIEDREESVRLDRELTTVGRGEGVDVVLRHPSVSRLHAEIVRRGPHVYVADLGLSTNGTRVNGRPVGRRLLESGDVIAFGAARVRIEGLPRLDEGADLAASEATTLEMGRVLAPDLTRREREVLDALVRPVAAPEAFVAPATARQIAAELFVTEAAVKQHLLRLYQKFRIKEGENRRGRLANEVLRTGVVRPVRGLPTERRPRRPLPGPAPATLEPAATPAAPAAPAATPTASPAAAAAVADVPPPAPSGAPAC